MPRVSFCVFVCCVVSGVLPESLSDLFYWREYTGVIPEDALPAGRNADGKETYIGEGYVHGHGLYIAQIYPGVKEVDLPCYGVKTATINIKILCTEHPEYFSWLKTSAKTYEKDTAGVEVVKAGYENTANNGIMNVGRVFYQGYVVAGVVTPFTSRKGNVQLFFTLMKVERPVNFYELLIVSKPEIDPRLGMSLINVTGSS